MKNNDWKMPAERIMKSSPVIPVIVMDDPDKAVPLAKTLLDCGVRVLEITLRTEAALDCIERIASKVPEALVGAGTVVRPQDMASVEEAGGKFAISPGLTPDILEAASTGSIPLIPGISTVSELMMGLQYGIEDFKFFPAEAAGGIPMLEAIRGPFPGVRFCPTGGIGLDNYLEYLRLENVTCVGGSWICPRDLVSQGRWQEIGVLARQALDRASSDRL